MANLSSRQLLCEEIEDVKQRLAHISGMMKLMKREGLFGSLSLNEIAEADTAIGIAERELIHLSLLAAQSDERSEASARAYERLE